MPFLKGRSGNPSGPPNGSNRLILLIEALVEGEPEALVRTVVDKAEQGDAVALRICFEAINEGLATGELAPTEAAELSKMVGDWVEALKQKAEAAWFEAAVANARARYAHLGPGARLGRLVFRVVTNEPEARAPLH